MRRTETRTSSALVRSTIFCLLLAAGCNSVEYRSYWRTRDIVIDGKKSDWPDSLTYLLEDKQTTIGFLNDGRDLFVCLTSANRDLQRQAMRPGLTFWFDRDGGEDTRFGVHYPLRSGRPRGGARDEGTRDEEARDGDDRPPDIQNESPPSGANEVEVEGPGEGDHRRMTMAEAGGIEVHLSMANDVLVYEIKVPLVDNGSHPFAIGAKPGALLGVGVEAIRNRPPERGQDDSAPGGEGLGGGGRRGGGGRGGRGGRGGGGGERSGSGGQPEPFKLWGKVQLAVEDSSGRIELHPQP